jgi:hypothetical protein
MNFYKILKHVLRNIIKIWFKQCNIFNFIKDSKIMTFWNEINQEKNHNKFKIYHYYNDKNIR